MAKAKKEVKPIGPEWLDDVATIDGDKWLPGYGELPAKYMIILERPTREDALANKILTSKAGTKLFRILTRMGFNVSEAYFTNAVKYMTPGNRAVNAGDLKKCARYLKEEIERCQPEVIVCMGANALKALMGRKAKLGTVRGSFIDYPDMEGVKIFAAYSPGYILRNPDAEIEFNRELQKVVDHQQGITEEFDTTDTVLINTVEQLRGLRDYIFSKVEEHGSALLCVDCEWNGITYMDPERYIRTVQIGFRVGAGAVVEFYDEGETRYYDEDDPENKIMRGDPMPWCPAFKGSRMDNHQEAWDILREIFQHQGIGLIGHNIIADGQWLLSYDIDIRDNVVYDTMLAEHTINETGPFNLTECTLKYTRLGRYDMAVQDWVADHKAETIHGYGAIPREILNSYGATDVDAPLQIAKAQMPELAEFMEPRGAYPSLWQTVLDTQRYLYEVEMTGMKVDKQRLDELCNVYHGRLTELENRLKAMAAAPEVGFQNFNYRSVQQVQRLLFDDNYLGLKPIKTTKGRPWKDILPQPEKQQDVVATPSTDGNTLDILQDHHPIAKLLRQVRKLDTAYKVFLKTDEEADESTKGGGIGSKIWPDGRMHAHFSQLAETGRFRHSKPNVANWPKRAESDMEEIFGGKDNVPPLIRTIVVPEDGYYLMEADFCQAELFVLAALSGDATMWAALTMPGKDLHDTTAISAFQLQVLKPDGQTVQDEAELYQLAADDIDAFEAYQKELIYLDQRGHKMTRGEFKSGIRVSAKNLNFGIPYGRGALDIARQVKGETGVTTDIEVLEQEVAQMMFAWKNTTYPDAWKYMEDCASRVEDPGFIANPWGRKRRFPAKVDRKLLPGMQRQAQNFPIQSTVADTCMIAMRMMDEYRKRTGLRFKLVNQIHDAIIVEVPKDEVEETKEMFRNTMGKIDIPINNSDTPLRLDIDIELMTRWGEKEK
jgi:uracil-DNA glycosylase family 4